MSDKKLLKFETKELKSLLAAKHFINSNSVHIVNKSKKFSFDDSFIFNNKSFDCGYHAIDLGRNKIYNDILLSLDIDWHTSNSTRSLVFNNKKYNRGYDISMLKEDFPLHNMNLFNGNFLKNLESIYGSSFIKFAIDEIASSYTQNIFWKEKKLTDEIILTNIYPWFFPNTSDDIAGDKNKIRPHFHNKMIQDNQVIYPKKGSFGYITECLEKVLESYIHPADNPEYNFASLDKNGKIQVDEETVHVLSIDYIDIATRFNLDFPDYKESNFYLVSVVLENPINFNDHEILVGDKNFFIDRVSSTDSLSGKMEIKSIQFECESFDEIPEEILIDNLKSFTKQFINEAIWASYNIKKVKLKRYDTSNINKKTNNILNFVESNNPQVVVINRHFNFENLSESISNLIKKINSTI